MKKHRQHKLFVHQFDNMLTSLSVSSPQLSQSVCFYKEEGSLDGISQVVFYKNTQRSRTLQTSYENNHLFEFIVSI